MTVHKWIYVGCIASLLPIMAQSQDTSLSPIDNVMKNARQAGSMCPASEASPVVPGSKGKVAASADMGCTVSAKDAAVILARSEAVAVDVRQAADYSSYHINGALNLAAQDLKYKSFLQKKPIVLIGNGKGERELYAACNDLKNAGFNNVKVLHGGMGSWLADQQSVIGNPVAVPTLLRITTTQLFAESKFDANLLVLHPQMQEAKKLLPGAQLVTTEQAEGTAKAIKSLIAARLGKNGHNKQISSVVLVAASGFDDQHIETLRRLLHPLPLLVHAEGTAALQQYARGQEAMWQVYARGPKQAKCAL